MKRIFERLTTLLPGGIDGKEIKSAVERNVTSLEKSSQETFLSGKPLLALGLVALTGVLAYQYYKNRMQTEPQRPVNTLHDLYIVQLQELYDAEKQLAHVLLEMAEATSAPLLRAAFVCHHEETHRHTDMVANILTRHGRGVSGRHSHVLATFIKETDHVLQLVRNDRVMDAALLSMARSMEHYKMAGYISSLSQARLLDYIDDISQLQMILAQEKKANSDLDSISRNFNFEEKLIPQFPA